MDLQQHSTTWQHVLAPWRVHGGLLLGMLAPDASHGPEFAMTGDIQWPLTPCYLLTCCFPGRLQALAPVASHACMQPQISLATATSLARSHLVRCCHPSWLQPPGTRCIAWL
jgi:hypothetical protein